MRHDDPLKNHPEIIKLKDRAKEVRIMAPNLSHAQSIEVAARELGFSSYAAFKATIK